MAGTETIHWAAPTIMLASLLTGVLLALGHHLFNAHLQGRPVPAGDYTPFSSLAISKQQFNASMGIAFAFFVRNFLAIAASATYVQVLWHSIQHRRAPTLADLDWAFAGLDNFLGLFNFRRGRKFPLLIILAIVFWCVPLATIFPPAALLVELRPTYPVRNLSVPLFDFATLNFAAPMKNVLGPLGSAVDDWQFTGPSQPLQNTALATMGRGAIGSIPAPAANASWRQDFWGPELRCRDADAEERDKMFVNVWNSYDGTAKGSYGYLAWIPWSADDASTAGLDPVGMDAMRDLPFMSSSSDDDRLDVGPPPSLVPGDGPASFWLAIIPRAQQLDVAYVSDVDETKTYWRGNGPTDINAMANCPFQSVEHLDDVIKDDCAPYGAVFSPSTLFEDATLLRCDLLNTSYVVELNYTNGVQNLHIDTNTTGNSPAVNGSAYFRSQKSQPLDVSDIPNGCATFHTNAFLDFNDGGDCVFDLDAVRLLSYQSILAAFNELVRGSVYFASDSGTGSIVTETDITRTVLAQTAELAWLREWHVLPLNGDEGDSLETVISHSSAPDFQGLSNPVLPRASDDLKATLEGLFQNLTMSLLAEPYFQ